MKRKFFTYLTLLKVISFSAKTCIYQLSVGSFFHQLEYLNYVTMSILKSVTFRIVVVVLFTNDS